MEADSEVVAMRTKVPKQIYWILDYERSLNHDIAMNDDERAWLKLHEWQLDTPEKREKMLQWYAPSEDDEVVEKPKRKKKKTTGKKPTTRKRRKKQKDKGLALYMQLALSWETAQRMGFTEKDQIQILKNYRNKGLSLDAIKDITKIRRDELIAKGVPA